MPILTKNLGMKNTCCIWPIHLIKVTFLTKCQAKDLVKMDKYPSKWPWFSQIGHVEWIGFIQINHLDFTLNQIDHYDLTFSQMNHIHLMI